jgi:hypothetical protein
METEPIGAARFLGSVIFRKMKSRNAKRLTRQ